MKRCLALVATTWALSIPSGAFAWGYEGHEIVAAVARNYLKPQVREKVDQMLAADPDTLTAHDMLSESNWADRYRSGHPQTSEWHFVDIELDHPDLKSAFPPPAPSLPKGPRTTASSTSYRSSPRNSRIRRPQPQNAFWP
jgi:S1/P1 Nuclease